MAGLGRYPALGFNVPQKLKPNARVLCWLLHSRRPLSLAPRSTISCGNNVVGAGLRMKVPTLTMHLLGERVGIALISQSFRGIISYFFGNQMESGVILFNHFGAHFDAPDFIRLH